MSIKFACPHCQTKLSARDEKVGRKFRCPKCEEIIRVPAPEEAAELQAEEAGEPTESPSEVEELGDDPFAEFIVYDTEIVYDTGDGPRIDASSEEGETRTSKASINSGTDYDRRFVAVRRSLLYVHGVLLGLVALAALVAGFFMGSAVRPDPTNPQPQVPGIQPVVLEGKLQYEAITGSLEDKRAVVIAFPEKVDVENKIPVTGLRPADNNPPSDHAGVQAIKELTGDYTRTNNQGEFKLRLRPGSYRVLLLSFATRRPKKESADRGDLAVLADYFEAPHELIGPNKYRLTVEAIDKDKTLFYNFGENRKANEK